MDASRELAYELALYPYGLTTEDLPPESERQPGQWFVRDEPLREGAVVLFERARVSN